VQVVHPEAAQHRLLDDAATAVVLVVPSQRSTRSISPQFSTTSAPPSPKIPSAMTP
jgi:hypothetical protein